MAEFFWDHMRILPLFMPQRLCFIGETLELQEALFNQKLLKADPCPNFLLFAEHNHIYTYNPDKLTGKMFKSIMDNGQCRLPAPAMRIKRSGSITYHGPGQLVCYMIINMADIGLIGLESVLHLTAIIDASVKDTLEKFGIKGYTLAELCKVEDADIRDYMLYKKIAKLGDKGVVRGISDAAGIWVISNCEGKREIKKICSRGIDIKKGVTKFGFALNVSTYLEFFNWIYPCGLDIKITSIKEVTGQEPKLYNVSKIIADILIKKFNALSKEKEKAS